MKLADLKLNPDNPRNIKPEKLDKLAQSIKDFPKMMVKRPIVYDENKIIIGGNMRYRAIQSLGMTEIPDEWTSDASDFTPDERHRFIMQDNAEMGVTDWDIVANQYELEDLDAWGIDLPQYEEPPIALPDADKEGFQQITFTVADQQADVIKEAIAKAKNEITGNEENENSNGNALYYMAKAYDERS